MLEIVPSLVTRPCLVGTEKRYSMQIFYSISISKVSPRFAIIEVFIVKFQDTGKNPNFGFHFLIKAN